MSGEEPRTVTKRVRVRRMVPGSPRAVLKLAVDAVPSPTEAHVVATAARVYKAPRQVVEVWEAVAAHPGAAPDATPDAAGAAAMLWHGAADRTRLFLDPPESGKVVDVDASIARAVDRAERCGLCYAVFRDGSQLRLFPDLCKARVCLPCLRRALRSRVDRVQPVFRVPLIRGNLRTFTTIGSDEPVTDRAGVFWTTLASEAIDWPYTGADEAAAVFASAANVAYETAAADEADDLEAIVADSVTASAEDVSAYTGEVAAAATKPTTWAALAALALAGVAAYLL